MNGGSKKKLMKSKLSKALPRRWCALYLYNDHYYIYAPSDWGNNRRILLNDTTLIGYYMDGPSADIIKGTKKIDSATY